MLTVKLFLKIVKAFSLSSKYSDIVKQDHHVSLSNLEKKQKKIHH